MAIPPDPNEPTRADLPPVPGGVGDPTAPLPRATTGSVTGTGVADRPPLDDEDDRRRAWWLWALLAVVLIGIVLWALLAGDDDDEVESGDAAAQTTMPVEEGIEDPAAQAPDDALAEEADDGAGPAPTAAPDTTAAPEDAGDGEESTDTGTVQTTDGTDVLTLVQGDGGDAERLAPHAGSDVSGTAVEVLEVVEGEGFWIGVDDSRRIFAHAADPATVVEVGQLIDFEGVLEPNPPADSADVHDIPEDQGAELHRLQGHHIEME